MGLVKIKHPDVAVLGECLEENVSFWEARGWALYDPDSPLPEESAKKAEWFDAGLRKGMTEEQLDGMTKAQIITHLAEQPELEVVDPDQLGDDDVTTPSDDEEN